MPLFRKFYRSSAEPPDDSPMQSIIDNLNHVLNTKRDYGSSLRDYGISDLSQHNNREDIAQAVMQEVTESINRYEPRVELNDIIYVTDDNPLRLSFTLRCTVKEDAQSLRVIFDTVFGKVNVGHPTK